MCTCWLQRFTPIRATLKTFTVLATTNSRIGWCPRFLGGFSGLPQRFQVLSTLLRQIHQLTIYNHPLTLVGAFAINIYITHKSVLFLSITICAPMEHQSNQFSSHSFHIDNTNIIFLPLSANFLSSNHVNGASKSFNNGNIGDALSTCTID